MKLQLSNADILKQLKYSWAVYEFMTELEKELKENYSLIKIRGTVFCNGLLLSWQKLGD